MFNLLKNLLKKLPNSRCFAINATPSTLQHLSSRQLIQVSGVDSVNFLQGLITNDIHHLDRSIGSLYAMFLNTRGRVLYDTLIYKTPEPDTFFLECDADIAPELAAHLKLFRVRRKVNIENLGNAFKIYALFNPDSIDYTVNKRMGVLDGVIVPCNVLNERQPEKNISAKSVGDLLIYCDPRVVTLGCRIIAPKNCDVDDEIKNVVNINPKPDPCKNYRWFRYNLGVGEGVTDLPPNNCFPLECNCDYLHGISFHKGCYIGQELTARTYHTGVIRKRLMPLFLSESLRHYPKDARIMADDKVLGKLRGVEGNTGLALLRIAQAIETENFIIENRYVTTGKPKWWPLEAPKEKMTA